jgi:hypothetical protein
MATLQDWLVKADKILGPLYDQARNHGIPKYWLYGLVFVECARLDHRASRFEPAVHKALLQAKEGVRNKNFPGFTTDTVLRNVIKNASAKDLETLATSYGFGQIMGYHYAKKWGYTPTEVRNMSAQESVQCTLAMMGEGMNYYKTNYERVLRWWNTGDGINGKTHNPDYCRKAEAVRKAAQAFLAAKTNGQ